MTATTDARTIVRFDNGRGLADWLPGVIRAVFCGRHGRAALAEATGTSERAADYYRSGQRDMRALSLIHAMAANEELERRVLDMIHAEREVMLASKGNQAAAVMGAAGVALAGGAGVAVAGPAAHGPDPAAGERCGRCGYDDAGLVCAAEGAASAVAGWDGTERRNRGAA